MKFNVFRNMLVGGLIACLAGGVQPVMAADNLDTYRDLLQKHIYTINFICAVPIHNYWSRIYFTFEYIYS